MNFNEAIKHITGEKDKLYRARDWMKRYIAAYEANKPFLQDWYDNERDMNETFAKFYQDFFRRWKQEEKSRKAKESRSVRTAKERLLKRKTHKYTDQEQKKLLRELERVHGRKAAIMLLEQAKRDGNVSDEQAKRPRKAARTGEIK